MEGTLAYVMGHLQLELMVIHREFVVVIDREGTHVNVLKFW